MKASRESDVEYRDGSPVKLGNPNAGGPVVVVCEHASNFVPKAFQDLGLSKDILESHIAWDPGALGVAKHLSRQMNARLVAGGVSRLVYDCNRPPTAKDAIPARSEIYDIPGNIGLSDADKRDRIACIYNPFRLALSRTLCAVRDPVLITVHSFTGVYMGVNRNVEIGILHDVDTRLSDQLLSSSTDFTALRVRRNEPYSAADGVTHTLKEHALPSGYLNVMIEIRNDLIALTGQQREMARMLTLWLSSALNELGVKATREANP